MDSMGPMILGFHLENLLMIVSGVFYLLCAGLLWRPYRQEKNELIGALFAFLVYQAISMFFMGIEMHYMNPFYGRISALAVLIGSVYMLKFPMSSLSKTTRGILFKLSLVAVLIVFFWLIQTPEREMMLMKFTLWYDLAVNGIIVGGFMVALGLRATSSWQRVKALGGGSGVVTCCIVANGAILSGAFLLSSVFAFLAPVIILGSLWIARIQQKRANPVPNR